MTMTNEEIVRDYCQARNKSKQIKILAELNLCSPSEIKAVLAAKPEMTGVQPPKRIQRRKEPPVPKKPDAPEVYQQIETVLASLPEGMGVKARWVAGKMLAELFAEYLVERLDLREEAPHD